MDNRIVELDIACPICGTIQTITLTGDEIERYEEYRNGNILIQEAFPNWPASKREAIMTGICDYCWGVTFNDNETPGNIIHNSNHYDMNPELYEKE